MQSGTELHALLEDRGYESADGVVVLRRVIGHRRSELTDLGGQHSSGRASQRAFSAEPNTFAMATLRNDDAT